jgi:hypothetical protein
MRKNIQYMVGSGALMLLTAVASVSCTEGNDWDVDSSYDRLFSVVSSTLSVNESTTSAEVRWTKTPDTEYYIIQVSKDSLYDGIDLDTVQVVTYGTEGEITASPFTLTDLDSSSKYFLRIQAASTQKSSSKWTYLDKSSFKTKAEQILNDARNITGTGALISWEAGLSVTHLVVTRSGDDEGVQIDLDAEAVAAGQYRLTGLDSKKTYNVTIWNNDVQRGKITFKTTEAYPEGFDVVTISDIATLTDLFTNPANYIGENDGNVLLLFPAGSTINNISEEAKVTVPAELKSIVFWGESGGETATFMPKGLSFAGDHSYIRFYNLNLQNDGTSGNYIINQNVAGTIGDILIENCTISNTRGVLRVQSPGNTGSINSFEINNCIIDNIGSYGISQTKVSGFSYGSCTIQNSTITNVDAGNVIASQQDGVEFNISNCTFYNCVNAATKAFIDMNKMNNCVVNISKTIVGRFKAYADETTTIKAVSLKIGEYNFALNDTEVYSTSDCPYTARYTWGSSLDLTSDKLFADPAQGDFHLVGLSLNAGDPRWLEEE